MYKFLFISIIGLLISMQAYTQDVRTNRLGLSGLYQNDKEQMGGAEISYQHYIKGIRRVEYDFGWLSAVSWDILQYTVVYQWRLIRKGGFNFYTGPGLGIGYANYGYGEDLFYGAVVADFGVDYTFEWPFQIGLRYRPGWSKAREKIGNDIEHQVSFALRLAF
ncbi:MAG: hypothetical protein DRJ05_07050 [Bacteroidetes bacterium]|nr:MAG: hypothetical protein DRJ05_07050 [Bacteroidota bacterium]